MRGKGAGKDIEDTVEAELPVVEGRPCGSNASAPLLPQTLVIGRPWVFLIGRNKHHVQSHLCIDNIRIHILLDGVLPCKTKDWRDIAHRGHWLWAPVPSVRRICPVSIVFPCAVPLQELDWMKQDRFLRIRPVRTVVREGAIIPASGTPHHE